MCLLIVLRDVVPDWPLILAANREEHYDREGEPPCLLSENPRVFGGRDPKAGGTWLAINQGGMVCAVANRPRKERPVETLRSRGLLCLDAARQRLPIAVADKIGRMVDRDHYDGFNLFCSNATGARCFYYDGQLREKPLGSGVHVITTGDANDYAIGKVKHVHALLEAERVRSFKEWIEHLEAICRDHAGGISQPDAPCMHGTHSGTVSSSILALHAGDPHQHLFRHAQGPPCQTPYETRDWPEGFFGTP
jgi:uncharacterized protein with NRDE domain